MWRKYAALNVADRPLIVEATALLMLVGIGLRVVPFRVLRRLLDDHARVFSTTTSVSQDVIDRISWAVAAVARRFAEPTMTCLVQALAVDAMLKRRGHVAQLRLGVRTLTPFEAHAWVECGGHIVIGDRQDLATYSILSAPTRS
jgi:hypothetical protein